MDMLPESARFVEAFCGHHGIGRTATLRLTLIVEELFTNTVEHGYRRECELPIRIELGLQGHDVLLVYEDAAPRFDPLAVVADIDSRLAVPLDARPVGKLGLRLVMQLAQSVKYEYVGGSNRIQLTLR